LAVVWGFVALYVIVFGTMTTLRHEALQSTAFDLGTMDQAIWNTSQGRILRVTIQPGVDIRLAGHVEPILLVVSLLYLLRSDPRVLLVLQTSVVAAGALPIYWLAKERLKTDLAALVFPLVFLLSPALEAANMFDFHGVTLAATFLAFGFYFAKREGGKGWFLAFMILTMSCREDMALLVVMMGLYLVLKWRGLREQGRFGSPLTFDRDNLALGALTLMLGVAWFSVALFLIPSYFSASGEHSQWDRYGYLGESPLEMLGTLLLRPGIVMRRLLTKETGAYLLGLLSPTAFLSIAAPHILLLSLPTLSMNLLSSYAPMHTLGPFHYAAPLVPFFIIASIYGTARLAKVLAPRVRIRELRVGQGLSGLVLLSSLVVHYYQGYTPWAAGVEVPVVTPHERLADKFFDLVPANAAVSTQSRLVPHLSQRERIYMFPRIEDAEYVLFDVTADSWPIHPNDERRLFESLISDKGFGILAADDGYIMLRKGPTGADELPSDFYDFARREEPEIQYPTIMKFGEALRLLGFDLLRDDNMTSLALYWEALAPLERDYRIYPFFYDDKGNIIEDTSLRPMTTAIWYPPSKWQPGEIVLVQTLPWDVGADFNVGLGVMDGEDWRIQEDRLTAHVETSTLRLGLYEQDTVAGLAEVRAGEITTPRRVFASPSIPHPLYANLGDRVDLLGYDLTPASPSPDDTIYLTLYWQARLDMAKDYTVFTHLIDESGTIMAQHDGQPQDGGYPTSRWVEAEIVEDEHGLWLGSTLQPVEYTLVVGMYDLRDGERLPAYDLDGELVRQGRVALTKIRIR
jgi:uncharacterized membrane protein